MKNYESFCVFAFKSVRECLKIALIHKCILGMRNVHSCSFYQLFISIVILKHTKEFVFKAACVRKSAFLTTVSI